jgi:hypothetical protein
MKLSEILDYDDRSKTSLLGMIISDKEITEKTQDEFWDGNFSCGGGTLTSLKYAPKEVKSAFSCSHNKLTSLEFGPDKVGYHFYCGYNPKLTSLEFCPKEIGGSFNSTACKLTSLKDIHKHLHKMKGNFNVEDNPIKSHVLGVLLIEGCKALIIDNQEVENIISKYLPNKEGRKGLMKCKAELVDAGYEDYAQL